MWSLLMHKNKKYCATIFGCSKSNVHQILRVQPQGLMSSVLHSSILWKDLPTFFGPGLTIFFLASWRPLSLWSKTQLCCSGNRCNWQKTKSKRKNEVNGLKDTKCKASFATGHDTRRASEGGGMSCTVHGIKIEILRFTGIISEFSRITQNSAFDFILSSI